MASIVKLSLDPRYCPVIRFPPEENAFIRRYLAGARPCVPEARYDPAEVPKRAFIDMGSPKTVPDFVNINARMAVCPEARALIEEFEPGVHQFLPVEIARKRSKKPILRLDGRVLDSPYHVLIPQVFLDAVWVERSDVMVSPTYHGPDMVVPGPRGGPIVLRREVVQGHHVWRGLFHLGRYILFSDALVRAIEARKLRKLRLTHLEEA